MKTSLHQNKGRQQERMQHRKKTSKFSGRTLQKPAYPFDPKNFLFSSNGLWFENAKFLPKVPHIEDTKLDTKSILEKKTHAKNLYDSQVAKFDQGQDKNSLVDKEWLKTVLHSGTSSDKIAAITLRIQSAPFYRLQALDMLLNSARKKGRRESEMAIEALKDLFINNLLPSHRKLISFQKRPLSRSEVTEPHLIFWYFEDAVKIRFAEFVKILEQGSRDTILNYRQKMLKFAFELLCEKPEQEQQLLTLVINKLGDPERKLASKVIHYLNLLLMRHPKMKLVVAKEVEVFLRRPNLSSRAQYYAILFLNQIILTRQNIELSQKLIQIYFQMFKVLIGQKHDVESKMLSALLTGVNRAFPFARVAPEAFQEELDTLFRIVHIATFNKSIQALLLIFQVLRAQGGVSDRYYRALYSVLFHPDVFRSSRQSLFLNLLYKSLKYDSNISRILAFLKRIFQICFVQKAPFVCGCLFLLSELMKLKPELKEIVLRRGVPSNSELKAASSLLESLSLGNSNALSISNNTDNSNAPSIPNNADNSNALSISNNTESKEDKQEEVFMKVDNSKQNLTNLITKMNTMQQILQQTVDSDNEKVATSQSSSEEKDTDDEIPEEINLNIESSNASEDENSEIPNIDKNPAYTQSTSNGPPLSTSELSEGNEHNEKVDLIMYDPFKRDPQYANSQFSSLWELRALEHHVHPSVAKWAQILLSGQHIKYQGDPIIDYSLTAFLDRFVYKKPKKKIKGGGSSLALQPHHIQRSEIEVPVNSDEFLKLPESAVPEQEMFFYKYFKQRKTLYPHSMQNKKKHLKEREDVDLGSDKILNESKKNEQPTTKRPKKEHHELSDDEVDAVLREVALKEMGKSPRKKSVTEKTQKKQNEEEDKERTKEEDAIQSNESTSEKSSFSYDELDEDAFEEDSETELNIEEFNKKMLKESDGDEHSDVETEANENVENDDEKDHSTTKRTFASLEEFEDLLKDENNKVNNPKQLLWEEGKLKKKRHFHQRKERTKKERVGQKRKTTTQKGRYQQNKRVRHK